MQTRKNMKSICYGTMLLMILIFTISCAASRSARMYSREQARVAHAVFYGTVLQVNPVTIEGRRSGLGMAVGGVAGGVAGSTIGQGRGSTLGAVTGAIAGGLAGQALEEGTTRRDALEITVEMDNGEIMAVVQEKDDEYQVGDRVRILKGPDGITRVRQ
jgi:outer membrane lipoprotein SlyB